MKNTNNFRRNLAIGFGASLLILLLSSSASFISIRTLLSSSELVRRTNEVIQHLNDLNTALLDAETGQRGYLLTGSDDFLTPYLNARDRALASLAVARELTGNDPQQQRTLIELRTAIDERMRLLGLNIELKKQTGSLPLENLESGRKQMQEVRRLIKQLSSREKQLLELRTEKLDSFAAFTPALVLVGSLIAIFITVVFFGRLRNDYEHRLKLEQELKDRDRETTERIRIIQGIADKISGGNYKIRTNDVQSDYLGSLAGALNRMASSLEKSFQLVSENEWVQTGVAGLSDVLVVEQSREQLASDTLEYVASYTRSMIGVFYVVEGDEIVTLSGYGYSGKIGERKSIHEGLIGQAIVSRKSIVIDGLTQENLRLTFGAGEVRPASVIAIPLFDGFVIKGIVELGIQNSFSQQHHEFFKLAGPRIGIALSVAENRKRLQELLEETQAQAEELQTQHSELENLNGELEVQAEKLQASEEELRVQQEELRHANQELEERSRLLEEKNQLISERNIEIQNKADELAKSARYKSEFLANMSHELRTPLNSILLLSRLMSENAEKNLTSEQIEYARVIQSSGNGLLSLIDEILDLSKIEAGKMQVEYHEFSVAQMVQDMQRMFSLVADDKGIEFKTEIEDNTPVTIETDRMRLEQILRNLISNAVKFTSKGYVKLHVNASEPNNIEFKVIDTGIGIAKDKQRLVFEAFQQADGSTRRKYGGTGLGLSISRELAKLLGGDIKLQSVPDEGSTFTVRVPVSRNAAEKNRPVAEVIPAESATVEKEMPTTEVNRSFISPVIPESIPDDRATLVEGDKVMLIIEDDINFAKSLLDYTRKRGYKGVVAVRGDEGVTLARMFAPLGILLDIQLPVKSGWEVMSDLKSDPQTRHIPVHIMSSHEVKTESLMKGAVDFINKPIAFEKIQEVFEKIEYVLSHHPKKVLIVEENPRHAKALAYFLETFDIALEIRNDVNLAIDSLRNDKVDCVILDMGIPDQRAYDTLEEVKRTPGLENLPIIIFTGNSLSQPEQLRIKKYADSIVLKTAHSYKRILDEVSLFLHLVEKQQSNGNGHGEKTKKLGTVEDVLNNKTVLVADDDMRNVFSLTKALEQYKMKVVPAVDGKDALNQLNSLKNVDVVLMDMMMPEMDGYETISNIRKNRKWKDLPIIAVTAKAMMGDRAKCINAGASDYITKPVDIDQLLSLLRVWLYERGY